MATTRTTVCAQLDPDELQTLEALESFERLRRSDIIRRALWHYAEHLGLVEPRKPSPTQ